MGFTKGQEGGGYTYIKIKGLEKASPSHYFEVEGERIEDNKFRGTLVDIEPSSYEFEGKEKKTIKMRFVDGSEKYQLDVSYNSISRNLINSLIGYVKNSDENKLELELSLYLNKENFKCIGILVNGERATWFLSMDEQKGLIDKIENKKGEFISNDYSALDEKLEKGIEDIRKFLNKNKPIDVEDIPF